MAAIKKVSVGEPVKADTFNRLIDYANASAGLNSITGPEMLWVGKASGTITARSGTTPGSGTVRVWVYDGSAMVDSGLDLDVLSPSAGIADESWCSIGRDGNDRWWLATAGGADVYQCQSPSTGTWAATGTFPATPDSFTADIYTLDGSPASVATGATVYYHSTTTLTASATLLVKSNGDDTYSVINWVC